MKRLFLLVAFLVGCSKTPPPPTPPPLVSVVEAEVADVPLFYEYVGHVEAHQTVHVKSQVAGEILHQFFVEGQEVEQNDLLLTIDPRPFQAALNKARGDLAQNLATLRQAKETAERYAKLLTSQYVSQLDYDQFVTDVYTAEAAVQQASADVETAQINLDFCSIQAPFKGITSKLLVNVGNYVPVGGESALLTLNQISPIRVSFYPPEKDLPQIAALHRQKALKTVAMLGENCIEGELFLIDNQVQENTGTILLQSIFANTDKKLWPGEFVDVRLILGVKENAVLVPSQAVEMGQDGPYVYVVKANHTIELRPVKVGQKQDDRLIIESGVSPHEIVVLEGQLNLYPGAQVAIR